MRQWKKYTTQKMRTTAFEKQNFLLVENDPIREYVFPGFYSWAKQERAKNSFTSERSFFNVNDTS